MGSCFLAGYENIFMRVSHIGMMWEVMEELNEEMAKRCRSAITWRQDFDFLEKGMPIAKEQHR